jgi:hypothetical protein
MKDDNRSHCDVFTPDQSMQGERYFSILTATNYPSQLTRKPEMSLLVTKSGRQETPTIKTPV